MNEENPIVKAWPGFEWQCDKCGWYQWDNSQSHLEGSIREHENAVHKARPQ